MAISDLDLDRKLSFGRPNGLAVRFQCLVCFFVGVSGFSNEAVRLVLDVSMARCMSAFCKLILILETHSYVVSLGVFASLASHGGSVMDARSRTLISTRK